MLVLGSALRIRQLESTYTPKLTERKLQFCQEGAQTSKVRQQTPKNSEKKYTSTICKQTNSKTQDSHSMPTKKCPVEGCPKIIEAPTEFEARIKLIAHIASTHTKP